MNAQTDARPLLETYNLEDHYTQQSGRVFLTGTQAIIRIALDQGRRDRLSGLKTGGLISGYRGSPVAAVDTEAWRAGKLLRELGIEFLPAVNEDLGATALMGAQQVESNPERTVEGVFGLWYGKGPGVDRSGDALKHGNAYGTSPHGGVLVVAGDDHGCVSSTISHQSDVAFMAFFMPTLNPASIAEYLAFGEYGYALSRYSGMWVGFKAISETVESAASIDILPQRNFAVPQFSAPAGGLHYRWPDLPGPQIEQRLIAKKKAVLAFAEANPIDRCLYNVADARYGFVTTGKAHLDVMEALRMLGLDEAVCRAQGIDVYKVGMVWPLAGKAALEFIHGKTELLVIEEKRALIESQLKEYFYDFPGSKPHFMVGKTDENGEDLIPWVGELSPSLLIPIIAARLAPFCPDLNLPARAAALAPTPERVIDVAGANRIPYFCSGCPHNSSTKVPEGSKALAGIGCHFMADWMDRDTSTLVQMGGEGVPWVGSSLFTGHNHVFQNLGDGTYYHSGSLAIRQAVAAKTNITYKILFNDAVAMTGGQPVDGPVSVQAIAHAVRAEGVSRIALVSDDPEKFAAVDFPSGVTIHHRRDLDPVQRELREISGVTVLIYEQTCATEKRRRRKRGTMVDPKRFVVINELVCEGCGDCSVQSNCLSVEPKETEFGRKRQINLSSCNKDFSCLDGFCPSFVTIEGGERRAKTIDVSQLLARADTLPIPALPSLSQPFDLVITGVGGTGVVTLGAIAAMAAHLEGKGSRVLDYTGLAQKFGPVICYLRVAETPELINQARIDVGGADGVIGCDLVVSTSPKASSTYRDGTRVVVNMAEMPTGEIVLHRDADLAMPARRRALARVVGEQNIRDINANALAERLLGNAVYANMIMLGMAWQQGLVPVSLAAMLRAIELNNVTIAQNKAAFTIGRLASAAPEELSLPEAVPPVESLDEVIERRAAFLVAYQNHAWAQRYREMLAKVRAQSPVGDERLADAVARAMFKLMSYKDEYEVARLHMHTGFLEQLQRDFSGDFKLNYHLAPPVLARQKDAFGRPRKMQFGPAMQIAFRVLAPLKFLRGTVFDPFGATQERRQERGLIAWYEQVILGLLEDLPQHGVPSLLPIARAPLDIRGYGLVKEKAVHAVKLRVAQQIAELKAGGCA